jgi:hypothetical protein
MRTVFLLAGAGPGAMVVVIISSHISPAPSGAHGLSGVAGESCTSVSGLREHMLYQILVDKPLPRSDLVLIPISTGYQWGDLFLGTLDRLHLPNEPRRQRSPLSNIAMAHGVSLRASSQDPVRCSVSLQGISTLEHLRFLFIPNLSPPPQANHTCLDSALS